MITVEQMRQIEKVLVDKGQLIEAGFMSLRASAIDPHASEAQLRELRTAFFAGAAHLFGSIMRVLDPGAEPTANDHKRLTLIHNELERFIADFKLRNMPTAGRG